MEQKVAHLIQRTPSVPTADPFLRQVPLMISNINACITHGGALERVVKGLHTGAMIHAATCTQNFTPLQTQISGQEQDMAVLKGTNEKLLAEKAKLQAQVAEIGNVLKWVENQVGQNSKLVAQSSPRASRSRDGCRAWSWEWPRFCLRWGA